MTHCVIPLIFLPSMVLCEAFNESRGQRCHHRAAGIDGQRRDTQRVVWLCRYHIREGVNYRLASSDSDDGWEDHLRFEEESETEEPANTDLVVNNLLGNMMFRCPKTAGYVSDDYRTCAICQDMDSSVEDKVAMQSCGHTYHTYCISGWVREAVKRGLKKRKRSAECMDEVSVQCPCCRLVCESMCEIGKPNTGFFTTCPVDDVCRVYMYFL